jgi:alpha-ribazole phosphatase/probable phosphoglycerate mutase
MDDMSDILFIRHGATDLAGTFCGHSDPPLNERGRLQVAALLEKLEGDTIEVVYASDLLRARETAAALATARGVPLYLLPGLREIHFGEWESLHWSEVEALDSQYANRWMTAYPNLAAPGGEAIVAFEERVLTTVQTLLRTERRPVAIVSHAGVMRLVMRQLGEVTDDECFARTKEYCSVVRLPRTRAIDAIAGALEAVAQGIPQ